MSWIGPAIGAAGSILGGAMAGGGGGGGGDVGAANYQAKLEQEAIDKQNKFNNPDLISNQGKVERRFIKGTPAVKARPAKYDRSGKLIRPAREAAPAVPDRWEVTETLRPEMKATQDAAMKAQSEERQRQALSQKEGDADRKLEEQAAKDQQKEEAAAVKEATKTMRDSIAGEREWRQAQEEYSRDFQDYEEKMASYEAAKSAHAKMSATPQRGSNGAGPRPFTQTPPQKPVPPTPGLFADKIPTPRSPEERDRLLPGTRYIDPAGNIRVRQ